MAGVLFVADLVAQGVEFIREPIDREWGLRTAHFEDPDGNIWKISQSLAADSDEGQEGRHFVQKLGRAYGS